jgi:hypothetical protein
VRVSISPDPCGWPFTGHWQYACSKSSTLRVSSLSRLWSFGVIPKRDGVSNFRKSLGRLKSRQDQSVGSGLALVRSSCTGNLLQFIFIQVDAPRKLLLQVQRLTWTHIEAQQIPSIVHSRVRPTGMCEMTWERKSILVEENHWIYTKAGNLRPY